MFIRTITSLLALSLTSGLVAPAHADDAPACMDEAAALADSLQRGEPATSAADWQAWTVELTTATATPKYSNITLKRGYVGRTMELWVEVAPQEAGPITAQDVDGGDTDSCGIATAGAKPDEAFFVRCDRSTTSGRRVEMYIAWDAAAESGEALGCAVLDEAQALDLLDASGGAVPLVGVEPDEIDKD